MIVSKLITKIKNKRVIVRTLGVYYIGFIVDYDHNCDMITFENLENKTIYIDCESITSIEVLKND